MNIGKAAQRSGVTPKSIRYYESVGLIERVARGQNGYRDYDDADIETLRFVHRGRGLGFSMEEVARLLSLWEDRTRASADVKRMTLAHIADIERKIGELEAMRSALSHLAEHCHGDDRPECPILDDLAGHRHGGHAGSGHSGHGHRRRPRRSGKLGSLASLLQSDGT
jgi:Cu(I)-responsive transcriptional regulator